MGCFFLRCAVPIHEMQLAAALPVIIIQPCNRAFPRGFECPQCRAQAEELPASVTSGSTPCAKGLVALGLCTLELGMPWRAQATNLMWLFHELNRTITHG